MLTFLEAINDGGFIDVNGKKMGNFELMFNIIYVNDWMVVARFVNGRYVTGPYSVCPLKPYKPISEDRLKWHSGAEGAE